MITTMNNCKYFHTNKIYEPFTIVTKKIEYISLDDMLDNDASYECPRYLTKVYVDSNQTEIIGKQFDLMHFENLMYMFKLFPVFETIEFASSVGNVEMLNFMYLHKDKYIFDSHTNLNSITCALRHGNINVAEWFYEKKTELNVKFEFLSGVILENANLDVIKWFYSKKDSLTFPNYGDVVNLSAMRGKLDIIEWFYEKWSSGELAEFKYSEFALNWATLKGHLHVVQWFYSKKNLIEFKYKKGALELAESEGHTHIIEWFNLHPDVKI